MSDLSASELRQMLWGLIRDPRNPTVKTPFRTQGELAKAIGLSTQYVNQVLNGKDEPSEKILDLLDIERIVVYRKRAKKKQSTAK